jgi:hypothetical protein
VSITFRCPAGEPGAGAFECFFSVKLHMSL